MCPCGVTVSYPLQITFCPQPTAADGSIYNAAFCRNECVKRGSAIDGNHVRMHSRSCAKKPCCWASPWRLFLTVIPGPLPGRLMACRCRWVQRWVSKPPCHTMEVEVWEPRGEEDSLIETGAKNKDNDDTRGWITYDCFFYLIVIELFFFWQWITCRSPSPLPGPSVSVCDYVTMQKSPTRMFIGGAHLWLILHNGSPIISALTRSVI